MTLSSERISGKVSTNHAADAARARAASGPGARKRRRIAIGAATFLTPTPARKVERPNGAVPSPARLRAMRIVTRAPRREPKPSPRTGAHAPIHQIIERVRPRPTTDVTNWILSKLRAGP